MKTPSYLIYANMIWFSKVHILFDAITIFNIINVIYVTDLESKDQQIFTGLYFMK